MSFAIKKTIDSLNDMLREISVAAGRIKSATGETAADALAALVVKFKLME
jgi:hypothetical protein